MSQPVPPAGISRARRRNTFGVPVLVDVDTSAGPRQRCTQCQALTCADCHGCHCAQSTCNHVPHRCCGGETTT